MPFVNRLQGLSGRVRGTGMLSVVALGAVYGLAGFCSGPVLGAILTMAATTSPVGGAVLLAVYAWGMAAPLFVLATLWDRLGVSRRSFVRGRPLQLGPVRTHTTSLIAGVLFVAIGVLFLRYDGTAGITGLFGIGDTTDMEIAAQDVITRWLGGVPMWGMAVLVSAGAAVWAVRRTRAGNASAAAEDEGSPAVTGQVDSERGR